MNRLAQLFDLSEEKMRNAWLWWDQTKPPAQVRGSSALPSLLGGIAPNLPPAASFWPANSRRISGGLGGREAMTGNTSAVSSSHFKTKVKLPHNLCSRKELSGDGIEQKRFYIKGKGYSVFLGQHMTKHSTWDQTWDKEGQKGQSPTAASCLFKCHITFTDAMSCDGVEGSHFVLCRLSVPFYTISLHNSPILGHSWYSKR